MFKIGQRYIHLGEKCTVHLVHKNKSCALVKYDNPSFGHSGNNNDLDYHCDDSGKRVGFSNTLYTGYYYIYLSDELKLIDTQIENYEIC